MWADKHSLDLAANCKLLYTTLDYLTSWLAKKEEVSRAALMSSSLFKNGPWKEVGRNHYGRV